MKRILLLVGLLAIPTALAQGDLPRVEDVQAAPENHAVLVSWTAANDTRVVGYTVYAYRDGLLLSTTNVTENRLRVGALVNERSYAFQVAARDAQGNLGPPSAPASAAPTNSRDLLYLASGLIVTWLSLFGYAALLARKEAQLDRKLDQLVAARDREETK
ncbi:MAG: CcmD family protein [Euryarchaeota archaeon]|nr:CcmD family protein [Euryarchaeota archaeon]